jgi:hypothetical protein
VFCGAAGGDFHLSAASPCSPWNSPCGQLIGAAEVDFECDASAVREPAPRATARLLIVPGVACGGAEVEIRYVVPEGLPDRVMALTIEDASGRLVKRFAPGPASPGTHAFQWNGLDEAGRRVPTGVYYCSAVAQNGRAVRQLLLVR